MDVTAYRRAWAKYRPRSGWFSEAWDLGQALRSATDQDRQLLVVGTETFDPWHVAAHLDDEARLLGSPALRPTLLRVRAPAAAPAHLSHTVDDLRHAGNRQSVFIVAPDHLGAETLERLSDARRRGATLFAITANDTELTALTPDTVITPAAANDEPKPLDDFEVATHVVTVSAGTLLTRRR